MPPHPHGSHGHHGWTEEDRHREDVKLWSTWIGIGLCVVLFFYITHLAKKALARAQAEQESQGDESFNVDDM